jgi:hypothetical protein
VVGREDQGPKTCAGGRGCSGRPSIAKSFANALRSRESANSGTRGGSCRVRQRYLVRFAGFHAFAGDRPGLGCQIDFGPARTTRLSRSRGAQHDELEQGFNSIPRRRCANNLQDFRHAGVWSGRVVRCALDPGCARDRAAVTSVHKRGSGAQWPFAAAQCSTSRMRDFTRVAVSVLSCQIGSSTRRISALVTVPISLSPNSG